jgi:hypothetical protein
MREVKPSSQEGRHGVSVNPCEVSSGQRSESGIGCGLMPSCDGFYRPSTGQENLVA